MCVCVVCMCVLGDGLWDKSFVKRGGGGGSYNCCGDLIGGGHYFCGQMDLSMWSCGRPTSLLPIKSSSLASLSLLSDSTNRTRVSDMSHDASRDMGRRGEGTSSF